MIAKSLSAMTKKEKKAYYKQFRKTWQFDPVTRKTQNSKAYNRKRSRAWKNDLHDRDLYYFKGNCVFIKQ